MTKLKFSQIVILAVITLAMTFGFVPAAYAHGVVITYALKANGEVELSAEFDTGEPMAEAQVTIYSPADPLTPWLTGTADAEGGYVFVIDPDMPGIWDIQYRKAGHGDMVHLQLETGMIDPALMEQTPGELVPATLTVETTATEAEPAAPPALENEPVAVEEETETVEVEVEAEADAADETKANNDIEITGNEIEAEAAGSSLEEMATTAEVNEPEAEDGSAETGAVAEAEPPVAAEPEAQAETAPAADRVETETAAQSAPEAASSGEPAGGAVAVLSSGGNTATTGGFTSFQIILMSASVIWGFVGTALYFSGKKSHDHGPTAGHHH